MKFIDRYLLHLEAPQGLTPRELYELGYMWAPEEELDALVITGPENFEME